MYELLKQDPSCPITELPTDAAQWKAYEAATRFKSEDGLPPRVDELMAANDLLLPEQAQAAFKCIFNRLTGNCAALQPVDETPVEIV